MCGLVGLFDPEGRREIDARLLSAMNDSQQHRGPDGTGIHVAPGIGLGHRRLAIIDLQSGVQPLFNEDGSVVVVYNGEIYNFRELADQLGARGHTFKTRCDTEVIVHAWEEWGPSCVERFRGMFAFALWDQNAQSLFLARDRLGIKPLYYAVLRDGTVGFASELKALVMHPGLAREIDPFAVEEYFAYGYVPDPRTIYRGVFKLEPGHHLVWVRGDHRPSPSRYWDVSFSHREESSEENISAALIERLDEATKIRMISDVPLGAFLSGGVDSSAVVASMAGLSAEPVNTCSIAFDDPQYDESPYATAVAQRYGTNHVSRTVDPDAIDLVDRLADIYDEPFADSSAMPTYRVCGLARERVTVALSGDGGDEIFAGYRRYHWHCFEESVKAWFPSQVRAPLFQFLGGVYPRLDRAPRVLRAKATLLSLARDTVGAYFHSVSVVSDELRRQLFSPDFRQQLDGYHAREVLARHMTADPAHDVLSRVQYADLKTYLPGDILTKVDRASMAHSLEVRVPMLDHPFVEWASGLRSNIKLRGGEGKFILKKAMESRLSNDLLYRRKMGFAVPISKWFRGPLDRQLQSALGGGTLAATGLFDMDFVQRLVRQHQSGAFDHGTALWSLVMFDSFLRCADGRRATPSSFTGSLSSMQA